VRRRLLLVSLAAASLLAAGPAGASTPTVRPGYDVASLRLFHATIPVPGPAQGWRTYVSRRPATVAKVVVLIDSLSRAPRDQTRLCPAFAVSPQYLTLTSSRGLPRVRILAALGGCSTLEVTTAGRAHRVTIYDPKVWTTWMKVERLLIPRTG
jgi:hypothetical protein